MHKAILYEYAVIRIVPRVEREEFINAGLILYSKEAQYLKCSTHLAAEKLMCLDETADAAMIKENLNAFEAIAKGKDCNSRIAKMDLSSRFRWLTATRSTVLQCSKIHPGYTHYPERTFEDLFAKLVL